ncbi:caspase family protein [Ruegeria meonggei]|uniref:caspase family protein n=1 Tax=Ruegeria meonggei TaxID=1446476 RepID=UPI00367196EE
MTHDAALVFQNETLLAQPATHVIIVAAGRYYHGKGKGDAMTDIGGDISQLSSPPVTAKLITDWFLTEFKNSERPLGSLSMCVSDEDPSSYTPPGTVTARDIPEADLGSVTEAVHHWSERLKTHSSNLAVFYFCGHGVSLGQQAALLLSDFGRSVNGYAPAIDLDALRGTMKNSPADQQLFLLDCCRTKVDFLYEDEPSLGTRILSIPPSARESGGAAQQCILFPTIDGEEAFGQIGKASVFATSFLDAVRFAAPDDETGVWKSSTPSILKAVDRLIQWRLPEELRHRSVPTSLDLSSFDFNEVDEPNVIKGFVKLSDPMTWPEATLICTETTSAHPQVSQVAEESNELGCCVFDLQPGQWEFSATLTNQPPFAVPDTRKLLRPVTYVELEVRE